MFKTGSPTRRGIFPSPWIVIAAAVILLVVVVTLAVRNINREKQHMPQMLTEKGAALIKAYEAGTRTGMMGDGPSTKETWVVHNASGAWPSTSPTHVF